MVFVGPTGVGKSRLAVCMAQQFNGEIVNGDSRQVYRLMDIGTAKPSPEELRMVPHHLFSIIDPDADFSLAQYQSLAYQSIEDILKRGKIPFLVGGSGQYIWGVVEGWVIPRVVPNPELRKQLENTAAEKGPDELYRQLLQIDPAAAQKIDKRNIRRVVRALEVSLTAHIPVSQLQHKKDPGYQTLIIGLTADRPELYRRIDARVEAMMEQGLEEETVKLLRAGYHTSLPSMSSIGYPQIEKMLKQEISREEAVRQIKTGTHRFARHQYAWFRMADRRIHWFDITRNPELEIARLIAGTLASIN